MRVEPDAPVKPWTWGPEVERRLEAGRQLKAQCPDVKLQLVLWAKTVFEGQKRSVVVAYVRKTAVRKLQRLLQEFEEAHNGIAMKASALPETTTPLQSTTRRCNF